MSSAHDSADTPLPGPTGVEQAALDWLARCQHGLSVTEEVEFEEWLVADRQHAEVFSELLGTSNLLDHVALDRGGIGGNLPAPRRGGRWWHWIAPVAAAAALAFGYFTFWRPLHFAEGATTEVGGLRTMRLPDGSIVKLNTNTELAVGFTPEERRVNLIRGEASFAVAKHPARPFVVVANGVAVRAVGTAFNVRIAEKSIEVLVLEGRVQVKDSVTGASLIRQETLPRDLGGDVLIPGQRAIIALPEPVIQRPDIGLASVSMLLGDEVQRRNAWQDRRLEFESAPLSEIVAEFNRYNRHKLVIADPALTDRQFGGSFKSDDAEGFVRMLRENFGIAGETRDDVTILRGPK